MMRPFTLAFAALLAIVPAAAVETRTIPGVEDAYKSTAFIAEPMPAIDAALVSAKQSGKRVLLVMGTGGCHDSAWLANLIATDRFAPVRARYEIVYADIGMPHVKGWGRNPEVAKRFRFRIKGTPTVAILDAEGRVLNRKAAPKWRNAASRSDNDIYNELMN
ncbi:MAG: thioredoxin family protein [Alphaproteobacteria bacterium]|nr:thioredoxin family protein [Alphaproteobacteria bacterium]MBU0865199.1 thioredoxin family protein [Alphaproteobacteria bacterium]MBU1826240.1 thioredoxin family protein [Alphaproteobacteria bacterium]